MGGLHRTNQPSRFFSFLLQLSLTSPDMVTSPTNSTIKFLCSYGGKILPRYPDGKLRYNGGHTRVLAVPRSVSFSELASKMAEMCGGVGGSITVTIRCQLPTEDLDALVSITSDEDLVNLIEEYDLVSSSSPMKIRVFLNPPKSAAGSKKSPPPLALPSSTTTSSSSTTSSTSSSPRSPSLSKPPLPPSPPRITTVTKNPCYGCYVHRNSRNIYLVHNGNHWQ